uniref:Uncharacterized protein n=1 Tax=Tetranychus urticae TaxID=32264 RepID=T1KPC9_TETUR
MGFSEDFQFFIERLVSSALKSQSTFAEGAAIDISCPYRTKCPLVISLSLANIPSCYLPVFVRTVLINYLSLIRPTDDGSAEGPDPDRWLPFLAIFRLSYSLFPSLVKYGGVIDNTLASEFAEFCDSRLFNLEHIYACRGCFGDPFMSNHAVHLTNIPFGDDFQHYLNDVVYWVTTVNPTIGFNQVNDGWLMALDDRNLLPESINACSGQMQNFPQAI